MVVEVVLRAEDTFSSIPQLLRVMIVLPADLAQRKRYRVLSVLSAGEFWLCKHIYGICSSASECIVTREARTTTDSRTSSPTKLFRN